MSYSCNSSSSKGYGRRHLHSTPCKLSPRMLLRKLLPKTGSFVKGFLCHGWSRVGAWFSRSCPSPAIAKTADMHDLSKSYCMGGIASFLRLEGVWSRRQIWVFAPLGSGLHVLLGALFSCHGASYISACGNIMIMASFALFVFSRVRAMQ